MITFSVRGVPVAWSRTRVVTVPRLRFVNPAEMTRWQEQIATAAALAAREAGWKCVDDGALAVVMVAYFPVAASKSAKERDRLIGKPHTQRPDVDNVWKVCGDALGGFDGKRPRANLYRNDSQVASLITSKLWTETGREGVTVSLEMMA